MPHKIRTFLWRFCKNNVLVRKLLRSKGVALPISFPVCENDFEHLLHLFFDCPFAKARWQIAGLFFNMLEVESAPRWLLDKFSEKSSEIIEKMAIVLWCTWFAMNKKVWDGQCLTPAIAMDISKK